VDDWVADVRKLKQVVINLLSNAVKFTPAGGRVTLRARRLEHAIEIAVVDTGVGIAEDQQALVFEEFRQAGGDYLRKTEGTGLGLALAKRFVELHGGTMRLDSAPGQGSTFTVILPLAQPAGEEDGAHAAPAYTPFPAVRGSESSLSGLKLMIVDDEADARELIEDILRGAGASVVGAASAREAMLKFATSQPDVLLSDIGMPGENGYDLVRQVRALPIESGGGVPAIALTAFARPEDRSRALAAGFQMHLAKPVERAELLSAVTSLVGRG